MEGVQYIERPTCPLCASVRTVFERECKDLLVSAEMFPLHRCIDCGFLYTYRLPAEADAQKYYDSPEYTPHSTASTGWMMRCVHVVRRFIREPGKLRYIRRFTGLHTGTMLDIGCGTGEFPAYMQRHGWTVTCTEPNEKVRAHCRDHWKLNVGDNDLLEKLPPGSFDVVTLGHVLEHVYDIHGTMEAIRRLLKDEGTAFVAVPNYDCPEAAWYGSLWSIYEVPRHVSHFSPDTLARLASMHGLRVTKLVPLCLDAFYFCILSEQARGGGLPVAFIRGFASFVYGFFHPPYASSIVYVLKKSDAFHDRKKPQE